jgi:hypothetical protein
MLTLEEESQLIDELIQEDDNTNIKQYQEIKQELLDIMNTTLPINNQHESTKR